MGKQKKKYMNRKRGSLLSKNKRSDQDVFTTKLTINDDSIICSLPPTPFNSPIASKKNCGATNLEENRQDTAAPYCFHQIHSMAATIFEQQQIATTVPDLTCHEELMDINSNENDKINLECNQESHARIRKKNLECLFKGGECGPYAQETMYANNSRKRPGDEHSPWMNNRVVPQFKNTNNYRENFLNKRQREKDSTHREFQKKLKMKPTLMSDEETTNPKMAFNQQSGVPESWISNPNLLNLPLAYPIGPQEVQMESSFMPFSRHEKVDLFSDQKLNQNLHHEFSVYSIVPQEPNIPPNFASTVPGHDTADVAANNKKLGCQKMSRVLLTASQKVPISPYFSRDEKVETTVNEKSCDFMDFQIRNQDELELFDSNANKSTVTTLVENETNFRSKAMNQDCDPMFCDVVDPYASPLLPTLLDEFDNDELQVVPDTYPIFQEAEEWWWNS